MLPKHTEPSKQQQPQQSLPQQPLPGALQVQRALCLAELLGAVCKWSCWCWLSHKLHSACGFCLLAVTLAAVDSHRSSHILPPCYLVTTHLHKEQLILRQLPSNALLGACLGALSSGQVCTCRLSSLNNKQNPVCDRPPLAL